MKILEKAYDVSDAFETVLNDLTSVLTPEMSYVDAKNSVMDILQPLADKMSEPSHPIKVVIDFYLEDGALSRFSAYEGVAWIVINMENMTTEDWAFHTTSQDLENVIFKLAQAFSKEISHYHQFIRNWNYHERVSDAAPFKDSRNEYKISASIAAQELVKHYGSATKVIEELKSNTRKTAEASPEMLRFLKTHDRDMLRRFLSDLYGQIKNFEARSQ